jgi:predicted neutral ceramidase superfamily lipid hydrolase
VVSTTSCTDSRFFSLSLSLSLSFPRKKTDQCLALRNLLLFIRLIHLLILNILLLEARTSFLLFVDHRKSGFLASLEFFGPFSFFSYLQSDSREHFLIALPCNKILHFLNIISYIIRVMCNTLKIT